IGATLALGPAADLLTPGSHGTTFGGNPLACRAALATLAQIEALLPHVQETGAWLQAQLKDLPCVAAVRGRGLFVGVVLDQPVAARFAACALDAGIILNAPRPDVIRLVPPLVVTRGELSQLLELWPAIHGAATK
ncbi:MAG: aminotransferase class III-fold pyridoxal phosphate-dependent enzyme, partial [Propionibacteriaceae bacterium]|nr:aminotransferase class III-fold pyridoxal phosphate-dependent enzyme [Propionibacteriaceae bacterium]